MKINADERNYTTIDEMVDEVNLTLAEWQDTRRKEYLNENSLDLFVNDCFFDYQLTKEEVEEIVNAVLDFWSDEE